MQEWQTKNGISVVQVLGGRSNAYLISYRQQHFLIDTGPSSNQKTLFTNLQTCLCTTDGSHDSLTALILTHVHYDHVQNARFLVDQFHVQVVVQRSETDYLTTGYGPIPKGTNKMTAFFSNFASKILIKNRKIKAKFSFNPLEWSTIVDETLDLSSMGINAYIIHTPGHSQGSISIIVDDEFALVGDTLFGKKKGAVFPPFADDAKEMIKSWKRLLGTNCQVFLPGHGEQRNRDDVTRQYAHYSLKFGLDT
jgi:glyoxylase-like metal-dependent hydrolase (beta-lactamase superfamily II)